jgi:hypothetical protein
MMGLHEDNSYWKLRNMALSSEFEIWLSVSVENFKSRAISKLIQKFTVFRVEIGAVLAAKCKGKGRLWKLFRGMVYLRMKEKL